MKMNVKKSLKTMVYVIPLMLLFFIVMSGPYRRSENELVVPTQEEILLHGYPRNEKGQTYGPNVEDMEEPDLQLAVGENNIQGYIDQQAMERQYPKSPQEAVIYMKTAPKNYTVPLYLHDGQTIIGRFHIGAGNVSEE